MRSALTIFFLVLLISGSGCNVINPSESIPTYVRIDSFSFVTKDYAREGSGSQKVTSAWVYFNNQAIGTFRLPATVPIVMDGPGDVNIIPGVALNGLSFETQYPFFSTYDTSIAVAQGKTISITPKINYLESAKFQWKEDFELGIGNRFVEVNSDKAEDTSITRVTDERVFEGGGSGYVQLDSKHPSSEIITNDPFTITQGKSYLELNYQGTTSFVVGLQTTQSGNIVFEYIGGVKAKDSWNKIYFDLSAFTAKYQTGSYRLMIKTTLDSGLSEGYVLLDNIKVVSF
ncbi:hypothetical protein [Polluticoccus soli]|uniref:hypothetical protein n=1 Tax=Polluticoccus soli TaxID=3034150 RepID=UPI0023E18D9A|nr:hypothetical protein [Flavipsychrobacter sp. JY13-12]